jgi:two-component system CheB/CheR fusion protein
MGSADNFEFEALLDYVKRSRGFDFTGYKHSSLIRRVVRRLQTLGIERYSDYQDYLEVHPEEFNHLFDTLLINVTAFFRDRLAWDYLASEIIPQIVTHKNNNEPIRVWSAGCASGEEAYTIAIAIAQVIGIDQFQENVKIYATDADEEALNQARRATYSDREVNGLTSEQLEQFFEQSTGYYTFRKDLRRSVIFGRHDLIQDAPISKIDLLICRNTLMYFNAETQSRILTRFHFALRDTGFLFLGKAEMLFTHTNSFTSIHLRYRVFAKVPKPNPRDRSIVMAQPDPESAENHLSNQMRLREAALDSSPLANIIVDLNGMLTFCNKRARVLFNLTTRDLGCPLQDLELSYRPFELRSCIEKAYDERRTISSADLDWHTPQGEIIHLNIQISPLFDSENNLLGASINFVDITRYKRLQEELENSNQELEMAYEELQSTNEELETMNEELQSTNEELETMNEELQSTNEELETINAELQSMNEELQTANVELQRRGEELNQSNTFLESILTSIEEGVVVIDRNAQVQIWNHKAEDLWGLQSDEAIGKNFLNLDIGLPVEQLLQPIRSCLVSTADYDSEVVLQAINRRRQSINCRVSCTPLLGRENQIQGVVVLMEEYNQE